jgi:hypothetical protein
LGKLGRINEFILAHKDGDIRGSVESARKTVDELKQRLS